MKIGIDLGGSKIEGLLLGDKGQELIRLRMITPPNNYNATIEAIYTLITRLIQNYDVPLDLPVGIGIPGTLSKKTGLVKNANSACLIGQALDKDLENRLKRKVKLGNDANCFTLSEATDGAGADGRLVFGVILGTGVGAGISIDKNLWTGPNSISGEWGHNPLPWPSNLADDQKTNNEEYPGKTCYCGKTGCIETFLSGPGLTTDHKNINNTSLTPPAIVAAASMGDENAKATLKRYQDRLARALASVINILDPDIIVLGGGISNVASLYDTIPQLWQQWIFSDECVTKLLKNYHGDSSGVRGAAWMWG